MTQAPADFYTRLPVFDNFADLMHADLYQPLPDDWVIGLADVVNSTKAIAAGRYKVVNTAGAAVIAAITNALGRLEVPFAFGGDGASFVVAPERAPAARQALADSAAWARDELDLDLRVAMVPVSAVRADGLDVRVARFAPSPHVSYAMFSGGGLAWAERALKAGRFSVSPADPGARPDLSGLSCRWEEKKASNGVILSVLLISPQGSELPGFRALVEDVLTLVERTPGVARPLGETTPGLRWPPQGLDIEARVARKAGGNLLLGKLALLVRTFVSFWILRFDLRVGAFDAKIYKHDLVENSDFRKYDDGLRLTIDCTPAFADEIERRLARAESDGIAHYGLHRQDAAIVTCITPSVHERSHVHFVDGAAGGYALAAAQMMARAGLGA